MIDCSRAIKFLLLLALLQYAASTYSRYLYKDLGFDRTNVVPACVTESPLSPQMAEQKPLAGVSECVDTYQRYCLLNSSIYFKFLVCGSSITYQLPEGGSHQ